MDTHLTYEQPLVAAPLPRTDRRECEPCDERLDEPTWSARELLTIALFTALAIGAVTLLVLAAAGH